MKTYKTIQKFLILFLVTSVLISCSKDDALEEEQKLDPIVGKWYLKAINDTDVSAIDCYKESYIASVDATEITFYILDREEDGSCTSLLDTKGALTNDNGFYYIGDEALDFTINDSQLTWRVDANSTLIFRK